MENRIVGALLLLLAAASIAPPVLASSGAAAPEKGRGNPVPAVAEAVESGRSLFASQCSMCHGARADGRGDLAVRLKLRVPDLTDKERQKSRTDEEWFQIIGRGRGDMPAEKRLLDQQKWEMILYLRTLAKLRPAG